MDMVNNNDKVQVQGQGQEQRRCKGGEFYERGNTFMSRLTNKGQKGTGRI